MAGNWTCAFPQTPLLADHAARGAIARAPAIANNDPRHINDFVAACVETRSIKRAREDGRTITEAEVARSRVRKHALASGLASSSYHAAGAPLWAIQLRDELRDDLRNDLRRRQGKLCLFVYLNCVDMYFVSVKTML
jgi:hypothetical protein